MADEPEVTIRIAREEDASQLVELCNQLGYPTSASQIKPRLSEILSDDGNQVYVAESSDQKLIGWVHVHLYHLFYMDLVAVICGLVVDEAFRGLGIGKKLMENAENWAKEKGCSSVLLRSNKIRKEAHLFYEKIGYQIIKEQYAFRKAFI